MTQTDINAAAERLADRIKTVDIDDPLMKHLEAAAADFLLSRGFDISTCIGCKAALEWLRSARVEDAFWPTDCGQDHSDPLDKNCGQDAADPVDNVDSYTADQTEQGDKVENGKTRNVGNRSGVDNAADWYIGEARLDGMIRILQARIDTYFSPPSDVWQFTRTSRFET